MRFYFLSEYPSAIKLNGIYLGQIYPSPKSIEIDDFNRAFIEVCPMKKGETPFSFIPTSEFLNFPDESYAVTDLSGGYFIKFLRSRKPQGFSVLCQERFSDALVTVFTENGLKISIESNYGFFAEELNLCPTTGTISRFYLAQNEFLLIELIENDDKYIAVYDLAEKTNRVYFDRVVNYSIDDGFWTETRVFDTLKHKIKTFYSYENGVFKQAKKQVSSEKEYSPDKTNENLVPYLFLEELLCGGNLLPYLDDELKNDISKIPSYFGEFIGVMPSPVFREFKDIGIVYKKDTNSYFVKYANFDIRNKKIVNFKIL